MKIVPSALRMCGLIVWLLCGTPSRAQLTQPSDTLCVLRSLAPVSGPTLPLTQTLYSAEGDTLYCLYSSTETGVVFELEPREAIVRVWNVNNGSLISEQRFSYLTSRYMTLMQRVNTSPSGGLARLQLINRGCYFCALSSSEEVRLWNVLNGAVHYSINLKGRSADRYCAFQSSLDSRYLLLHTNRVSLIDLAKREFVLDSLLSESGPDTQLCGNSNELFLSIKSTDSLKKGVCRLNIDSRQLSDSTLLERTAEFHTQSGCYVSKKSDSSFVVTSIQKRRTAEIRFPAAVIQYDISPDQQWMLTRLTNGELLLSDLTDSTKRKKLTVFVSGVESRFGFSSTGSVAYYADTTGVGIIDYKTSKTLLQSSLQGKTAWAFRSYADNKISFHLGDKWYFVDGVSGENYEHAYSILDYNVHRKELLLQQNQLVFSAQPNTSRHPKVCYPASALIGSAKQYCMSDNGDKVLISSNSSFGLVLCDRVSSAFVAGRNLLGTNKGFNRLQLHSGLSDNRFLIEQGDSVLYVLDGSNLDSLAVINVGTNGQVLNFSGDESMFVSTNSFFQMRVWDSRTLQMLAEIKSDQQVVGACLSPDNRECAFLVSNGELRGWNLNADTLYSIAKLDEPKLWNPARSAVWRYSRSQQYILTEQGIVDVKQRKLIQDFNPYTPMQYVGMYANDSLLVYGEPDALYHGALNVAGIPFKPWRGIAYAHPTKERLATFYGDTTREITLHDARSLRQISSIETDFDLTSFQWSSDGSALAFLDSSRTLYIWKPKSDLTEVKVNNSIQVNRLLLSPQPADQWVHLQLEEGQRVDRIELRDMRGQSATVPWDQNRIDVSSLTSGLYNVVLWCQGSTVACSTSIVIIH